MVEKKSGPVKPPIIDAKPRAAKSADAKPAAEKQTSRPADPEPSPAASADAPPSQPAAKPAAPEKSNSPPPKPESEPAAPEKRETPSIGLVPLAVAAGAGGLAGLALAYGLAALGLWPQPDTGLAAMEGRSARLEQALAQRESEAAEAATRIETIEGRLAGLESLEPVSTEGLAPQADLDALAGRLADLSARIDAVAAGATGEEVTEVADTLSGLTARIEDMAARLDTIEPQIAQTGPELDAAMARLDDLDARIADQDAFDAISAERDRVARLPAALSALETAIASGGPFAAELAGLQALLPALEVTGEARAAASGGALPPDELLARFRAAIPAILAARPADPEAGWAETLLDQAASTLALRPTEGDSPQALVGRTEAALASGDLDGAEDAFGALPAPMQDAAPGFAEALDATQAARALIAAARSIDPAAAGLEAVQ